METKLWAALCALLLINFGSAEHDGDHAAPSTTSKSPLGEAFPAPVAESVPGSSPGPKSPVLNNYETNTSSSGDSKMSNNTTSETIPVTSEPRKDNAANNVSLSVDGEKNESQTNQPPSHPSLPPSESPITHISPSPPNTSTTHHTSSADVATTPSPNHSNTSHHTELPLSDSPTQSHQSSPTTAPSVTSSPTSEPQATPTTTTITTTKSTSTSSTSSSYVATTSQANKSQSSSEAHPKTTNSPASSSSTQTKPHPDTPSQLNVGGDAKKDSPALDPLLAGLVSAFIITAVIITLLLFLKLRRRDNRPEFRRLQDLPMDDMMEDTPLSMYNY